MTIQYASDLHLEFRDNARYLRENPIIPIGDILLLAGDIGYLNDDNYKTHPFWDWASDNFHQTLIVPGNHEFYKGYDLGKLYDGFNLEIRSNVHCYYNALVSIGDIDLILSTLWSHIALENAFVTERSVSDFHRVIYNERPLTTNLFNEAHEKSLDFLSKAYEASKNHKKVVVSHHVPTSLCMADEFKGSSINGAFVAELYDFIYDKQINYWVYGHSHRNLPMVDINGTKMVCNQLGYVHYQENLSFSRKAFFEL